MAQGLRLTFIPVDEQEILVSTSRFHLFRVMKGHNLLHGLETESQPVISRRLWIFFSQFPASLN